MQHRKITIFDTTLRDGGQSPGIGVDVVEAGFAISSPGGFEGVRAVAETQVSAFRLFTRLADERKAVTLYDVFEEVPVR